MHGHPLARKMEQWHRDHNGRHDDPEWQAFLEDLSVLVRTKLDELGEEHTNHGRFGMSKAGGCVRSAGLKALGYEEEPVTGASRMTFLTGHLLECVGIATLRRVGLEVTSGQSEVVAGPWHSYTDGIISDLDGSGPAMLSIKTAGYKKSGRERRGRELVWVRRGFPELPFSGVLKAQPHHYAQMQAEMYASGIHQALYLVIAKDHIKAMEDDPYLGEQGNGSLAFYTEVVAYNPGFVEGVLLPTWEQASEDVEAGRAPAPLWLTSELRFVRLHPASLGREPNASLTGTFNPCDYCSLVQACRAETIREVRR